MSKQWPNNLELADIEDGYIRIERDGIENEEYWAAINGTDFTGGANGL